MPDSVATESATQSLKKKHPNIPYRKLGKTQLYCSEIGLGAYRIEENNESHQEALEYALNEGVNLIDTSSNYSDGGSERLIGTVLNNAFHTQQQQRDEVIIVSKAGYIQGKVWDYVQERKKSNTSYQEVCELDYGLAHCIHPEFLYDQLCLSLERLQLETIDIFLLHNPEYFLMHAQQKGIKKEQAQKDYLDRIKKAFDYLEEEVQNGRINYFGISSNTFPDPKNSATLTPLDKIIEFKHPHFAVIQCPLNLFESNAIHEKNQPNNLSCLQLAQKHNLGVLINRPLNAYHKKQLICLRDLIENNDIDPDPTHALNELIDLEQSLINSINISEKIADEKDQEELTNIFNSATYIHENWEKIPGFEEAKQFFFHYIHPRLNYAIDKLHQQTPFTQDEEIHLQRYLQQLNSVASSIIQHKREQRINELHKIKSSLQSNASLQQDTLSQSAVTAIRHCPEVSTVLVGMRQKAYVQDQLNGLKTEIKQPNKHLWKDLKNTLKNIL
ncbi:MAG: aldo/keto reductase [bacterium]